MAIIFDVMGRIAMTALIIACGAADDEVDDVQEALRYQVVPEQQNLIVAQVRQAIQDVRHDPERDLKHRLALEGHRHDLCAHGPMCVLGTPETCPHRA